MTSNRRSAMVEACAAALGRQTLTEMRSVLDDYELSVTSLGVVEDAHSYLVGVLDATPLSSLQGLYQRLVIAERSPFDGDGLKIFMSHLSDQKGLVDDVSQALRPYRVQGFVAHTSISPTAQWQDVVEAALTDCDALAAFVVGEFCASEWCDQEVGWVLGRGVPAVPLAFGAQPYGLLGKYQSVPCRAAEPEAVAASLMAALVAIPALQGALAEQLSRAFHDSATWNFTRAVMPLLDRIPVFTPEQLERLSEAAEHNKHVYDCDVRGTSGSDWTRRFVVERAAAA
ncbi:TIR domain-containing protein [Promicromonospora kroppenstedtii]|uniref:TIR domain-containing protein n=1 Tax=Promicromonospora kroppenstedtii TaxID=440482 RepID=A0ABW7XP32_9MICO